MLYQDKSIEELDAILRDEEDVNIIIEVIRELERRGEIPEVDVNAAWNDFVKNYLPKVKGGGRRDNRP